MKPTKADQKLLAKSFGKYGITPKPTADGALFVLTDQNERPYTQSAPMTFDDARGVLAHIDEAVTEAFAHAIAGLTEAAKCIAIGNDTCGVYLPDLIERPRGPSPGTVRTIGTCCVGATLYRGGRFGSGPLKRNSRLRASAGVVML